MIKRTPVAAISKIVRNLCSAAKLKLSAFVLIGCLLVSLLVSLFTPFLSTKASAAGGGSNINLIQRTDPQNPPGNLDNLTVGTCTGAFSVQPKLGSLLSKQFNPNAGALAAESSATLQGQEVNSWLGQYNNEANDLSFAQLEFLLQNLGTSKIPIISFAPGSNVNVVNGTYKSSNGFCSQLIMLPVSNTEWRGFNIDTCDPTGQVICGANGFSNLKFLSYLDFKCVANGSTCTSANGVTHGTLTYPMYISNNPCQAGTPPASDQIACNIKDTNSDIDISGAPDFSDSGGGTGTTGAVVDVSWTNVQTMTITSGPYKGEVYTKQGWNDSHDNTNNNANHSYYFLTSVPDAEQSSRGGLTVGAAPICLDAPILAQCPGTSSQNCVPFISSNVPINLNGSPPNGGTVAALNSNIARIGLSSMKFYDYDTKCKQTTISPVTPSDQGSNSTIWLYYSAQNDAFVTIFNSGDGNEQRYIGQYSKNPQSIYAGGQSGCDGLINASPPKNAAVGTVFAVRWDLYDNKCSNNTLFGSLNVEAILDEADFNTTVNNIAQTPADTTPPKLCESLGDFGLSFLVCPVIDSAEGLVALLDNAINSMLTLNNGSQNTIFGNSAADVAYHKAWANFRTIALSLIAIASLVAVIAQALGMEFIDAYTVRKLLPKILIVSIAIPLSWPLLQFAVNLSDDAGNGIRNVIYAPFSGLSVVGGDSLGGGSSTVLTLVGTGGILAFGWLGLLSFLVTALLAALVGFAIMAFRVVLAIFLIMLAPFAIACYVLPTTHKGWVIWRDALLGVLLVFVIISAMIATGRVFAVTSFAAAAQGTNPTLSQIIGVIAYFAPYLLISKAFSWAGGVLSSVGGFVNDRSRGAFDRLKKYRSNKVATNLTKMRNGDRFRGSNALSRAFNNTTQGVASGWEGHFGLGRRGAAMRNLATRAAAAKAAQGDMLQQGQFDDDGIAALYLSAGQSARRAHRELRRLHQHVNQRTGQMEWDNGWNEGRVNDAVHAAEVMGINRSNAIAAGMLAGDNKMRSMGFGQEASDAVAATNAVIAGGQLDSNGNFVGANSQLFRDLEGGVRWHARTHGAAHVADNTLAGSWDRSNMQELNASTPAAKTAFMQDILARLGSGDADVRNRAATQALEMHTLLSHGTDATSQEQILSFENAIGFTDAQRNATPGTPAAGGFEGFLATQIGTGLNGTAIRARARTYDAQSIDPSLRTPPPAVP